MKAGFPAGTLSGAPKVRAMEIIDEVEPVRRGMYAGCAGYFAANGSMDTCILLRTGLVKDNTLYVQAGVGVVADSDLEAEFQESVQKAAGGGRAADEAEILTMATLPHSRRMGVAGQLLESAVQDLRSVGVTVLHLEVAVDNAAARALYNRASFAEVGCRRGYYRRGEHRIDALVLTRELNSPPHCAYVPVI